MLLALVPRLRLPVPLCILLCSTSFFSLFVLVFWQRLLKKCDSHSQLATPDLTTCKRQQSCLLVLARALPKFSDAYTPSGRRSRSHAVTKSQPTGSKQPGLQGLSLRRLSFAAAAAAASAPTAGCRKVAEQLSVCAAAWAAETHGSCLSLPLALSPFLPPPF